MVDPCLFLPHMNRFLILIDTLSKPCLSFRGLKPTNNLTRLLGSSLII